MIIIIFLLVLLHRQTVEGVVGKFRIMTYRRRTQGKKLEAGLLTFRY